MQEAGLVPVFLFALLLETASPATVLILQIRLFGDVS